MKKILIVGPRKSQHIQKWFSLSEDLELHLFTIDPGGCNFTTEVKEYTCRFLGRKFSILISIPFFIYTWWRIRPEVTNFHYLSSYGLLSLFVPKRNLILSTWGSDVNKYTEVNRGIHLSLIKIALRRFCWINAPAEHMKKKLIKLGVSENLIEVYQYGVPSFERKVPHFDGVVNFISNRNWDEVYRIEQVVDGFVYFLDNYDVEARLYLYGRGGNIKFKVDSLLEYRPELREHIVVKGYTEHSVMVSEMKDMDVFISIPRTDGMPLSLLEAMEVGLYPLLSDIDANHEWVDAKTGIICKDVNDEISLARAYWDAYNTLVNSCSEHKWESENRKKVRERGSFNVNVTRFLNKVKSF